VTTKELSKRGRPRGFDLDQALLIAQALFHQRGYDGVGVAELSKAIGVTAPSLYSAFGNKRGLFERVLERYVAQNGGWIPEILAQDDLEDAIAELFARAATNYAENPECPGCLALDGTRNCTDEQACAVSATYHRAMRQMIRDRVAQDAPDQADTLANYVVTILVGLSGSARDGMKHEALRHSGAIAAAGFAQQLRSQAALD